MPGRASYRPRSICWSLSCLRQTTMYHTTISHGRQLDDIRFRSYILHPFLYQDPAAATMFQPDLTARPHNGHNRVDSCAKSIQSIQASAACTPSYPREWAPMSCSAALESRRSRASSSMGPPIVESYPSLERLPLSYQASLEGVETFSRCQLARVSTLTRFKREPTPRPSPR